MIKITEGQRKALEELRDNKIFYNQNYFTGYYDKKEDILKKIEEYKKEIVELEKLIERGNQEKREEKALIDALELFLKECE